MKKRFLAAFFILMIFHLNCDVDARKSREKIGGDYKFTEDWVTRNGGIWRKTLAEFKGKPNVTALEVGTFEGRAAVWFLENILTHPSSSITCIDIFTWPSPRTEEYFDHNMNITGAAEKVRKIKGKTYKVLRELELSSYDFIYIDACHDADCILTDAVMSFYLLKQNGVLIFDDYLFDIARERARRPLTAIDAFLEIFGPYLDVLVMDYQVIVRKKAKPWFEE